MDECMYVHKYVYVYAIWMNTLRYVYWQAYPSLYAWAYMSVLFMHICM